MSISMYEASIPHFVRMLGNLSSIIDKAIIHAKIKQIDESVFINARLAPDMYPLSQQIRIAADMAKACAARMAGVEIPRYEDNETSFTDYKARIAKTIAFLQGIDSEQIDNSYDRPITIKLYDKEVVYTGQDYLLDFLNPNVRQTHQQLGRDCLRQHSRPIVQETGSLGFDQHFE